MEGASGFHLSPAGQVLLGYADRLLDLAQEAREAVQDVRPRGLFRLGAMESTAAVRLPGPLSEYHRRTFASSTKSSLAGSRAKGRVKQAPRPCARLRPRAS